MGGAQGAPLHSSARKGASSRAQPPRTAPCTPPVVPPWHGAAACSPRGPSTAKDLPLPQSGGTLSPSAGGSAGSPVLPPAPRCFWASLRPCSALSKPQFPSLMQEAQRGIELQRAESCSAPGSCRCLCSNPMAGDPSPPAPAPCPPHICIHAEQIRAGTKRRGCLKPPQPSSPPSTTSRRVGASTLAQEPTSGKAGEGDHVPGSRELLL